MRRAVLCGAALGAVLPAVHGPAAQGLPPRGVAKSKRPRSGVWRV